MKQTTAHYDRVKEFMRLAGQDVPEEPTIPSAQIRKLRARLILEEALETIMALGFIPQAILFDDDGEPFSYLQINSEFLDLEEVGDPALEELIDGCTDISVVTIGTLIAFGLPDIPFLEETDKANLRKFEVPKCPNCGNTTMRQGEDVDLRSEGLSISKQVSYQKDNWFCENCYQLEPKEIGPYTRSDGKYIKPPYWIPPNHLQHIPK